MADFEIPKYSVIQYVRNNKRIPHGVIVAVKCEDGFRIGYSLCNKKDRFNKRMALKIALGRAEIGSFYVVQPPHPVAKIVPAFVERCKKYYKESVV